MEAFMPSEIGRLIYGYLFQQCGEGLADEFLNTCDSMRECRLLKQKYAKNFHHTVQDLSLEDILNQYSVLCSLVFKQASTEEPVHRNVLSLLKKVLNSKLFGLSGSSANRHRVAKPAGDIVDSCSGGKSRVPKTGSTVGQTKQPENPADLEGASSVQDETEASRNGASVAELEQQANPPAEDDVAFSPDVSDAGDYSMDVDGNDSGSGDMPEKDSSSNVAKESVPLVASSEYPQKNISPAAESRICAILCNSALLEEHARQALGTGNLPFPAEYRTPRKQNVLSVPSVPTLSGSNLTKTPIPVASQFVDVSVNPMKSFENVSKSLSSMTENSPAMPKSSEHLSQKPRDEAGKKEKVLQQRTSRTPSKSITKSSSVAFKSSSTNDSVSPVLPLPVDKVDDQLVATALGTSTRKVSTTAVVADLLSVPAPTVLSVNEEPRVLATSSLTTKAPGVPAVTSTNAIGREETADSVFGELSFDSECSLPINESNTSVKSDSQMLDKLRHSQETDGSLVDSAISMGSSETIAPIQNLTGAKAEIISQIPRKSAEDAVVLSDSDEIAMTGSRKKGAPWDLNLRTFVDDNSPMDAHITKRKPKEAKCKKPKEPSKKRKHNDGPDELLSTAKRFKSETIAAVPVGVTTARQSPLVSKSEDADRSVDLTPSPLKRRRAGAKEAVVESIVKPAEKKVDRRANVVREGKTTPKTSSRVKVNRESKRTPEAANAARPLTSMNNIVDFDRPLAEKEKSDYLKKAAAAEKKKQQVVNAKKASSKESREAAKARSSSKPAVPVDEKAIDSIGTAKGRKRSEKVEGRVAAQKKSKVDAKPSSTKEPNHPQVKEKPSFGSKNTDESHRKDGQGEASVKVDKKVDEILKDHHQSSVVSAQETAIDDPKLDDEEDFEVVLEISREFELFHRSPKYGND